MRITAAQLTETYILLGTIKRFRWPVELAIRLQIIRTRLEVDASVVLGHLESIGERLRDPATDTQLRAALVTSRAIIGAMTFTTTAVEEYGTVPLSSLPLDFCASLSPEIAENIEWLFPGVTNVCRQIAAYNEQSARGTGAAENVQEG